jgi:hypothetical protein
MLPELRKLGVAPEQRILVQRAPKIFVDELRAQLPPGARMTTRLEPGARYDVIFDFPPPDEDFDAMFERLQRSLVPNGALWVVIPNQRAAKARGVRYDWNALLASALKTTLVDNKTLSFSPEEYGTRFVIRKIYREKARKDTKRV